MHGAKHEGHQYGIIGEEHMEESNAILFIIRKHSDRNRR
jgi:hypothetical protein